MNTRFNPTANGQLHLGHLYLVLVNYWTATNSGGRFIVRFDDDQQYWSARLGRPAIDRFCDSMREDLQWMGIQPDLFSFESQERANNEAFIKSLGVQPSIDEAGIFFVPKIVTCDRPYPYVPYLTAAKVAQDYHEGIDCLIRGEDLISEFALYCYFCDRLGVPTPCFYYIPKLLHKGDDLSDVSKTSGRFKLADLRNKGYRPDELKSLLAVSCLIDPDRSWCFDNVKRFPMLVMME